MRVAIYTRISRDDSGEGKSNERQEEACRLLCQMRGWEVIAVEGDVSKSAFKDIERPGWDAIESLMRAGAIDVVVAWKLDRVTRRVSGLVDLILLCEQFGVSFATTDGMLDLTSPTGKAVATILAAVAQMEVELKAERQRLANEKRAKEGQRWTTGWRSFGYTMQGEVIEPEAAAIREGASLLLGNAPLRQIAARWQDAGLETPRKSKHGWTHTSVRNVFENPKLAGYNTYQGEIIGDGNWEPILDRETFGLIQAKLSASKDKWRTGGKTGRKASALLSGGIGYCAECGDNTVIARTQGKRDGSRYPTYACKASHFSYKREEVDRLILDGFALAMMTHAPGMIMSIPKPGQATEVMAAIEEENAKLQALADSFSAGRIPLIILESSTAEITKRIAALEKRIDPEGEYDPRKLNGEALRNFAVLDLEGKRAVLKRLCRVTLRNRGGNSYTPYQESIDMEVKVTGPDGSVEWVKVF